MKMKKILNALTLVLLAGLMCLTAFAAEQTKHLKLYQDVEVNGTRIPAGNYALKFDPASQNSQVEFLRGSKTVATVPGHVKQLPSKATTNEVILKSENGKTRLDEVQFGGSTTDLVLGSSNMTAGE